MFIPVFVNVDPYLTRRRSVIKVIKNRQVSRRRLPGWLSGPVSVSSLSDLFECFFYYFFFFYSSLLEVSWCGCLFVWRRSGPLSRACMVVRGCSVQSANGFGRGEWLLVPSLFCVVVVRVCAQLLVRWQIHATSSLKGHSLTHLAAVGIMCSSAPRDNHKMPAHFATCSSSSSTQLRLTHR